MQQVAYCISNALFHAGVLQADDARLTQLRCHTSKEGHVFRKFTWGKPQEPVRWPQAGGLRYPKGDQGILWVCANVLIIPIIITVSQSIAVG